MTGSRARPGRPAPSVLDVARRAGVATGTVSNVLNQPEKVAEATRLRVEAAMRELSFVRNASARSLVSGVSDTVGLVVVDLANSMFVDMVRGAEHTLAEAGLRALIGNSDVDQRRQDQHLAAFDEARAAGVLLAPLDGPLDAARAVSAHGRPVVLMNAPGWEDRLCSVRVDEELGGYLAAQHLVDAGARHVVYVGGPLSLRAVRERLTGARRAIAAATTQLSVLEVDRMRLPEGRVAGTRLLTQSPPVDAVLCSSDLLAAGVVESLTAEGRRVGDDVLVLGYDDNHLAADCAVPLSSVRQPAWSMGVAAARLLLDEMHADEHVHETLVLPPELVVRASTTRSRPAPEPSATVRPLVTSTPDDHRAV